MPESNLTPPVSDVLSERNPFIDVLSKDLPSLLWRHKWNQYRDQFGLPYSRGTMQNFDSEKTGPKLGRVGNQVFYLREDYLLWLAAISKYGEVA